MSLILIAGCAAGKDGGGKTVLHLSNWGGAGDNSDYERIVQQAYRQFEKENPGAEVKVEGIPEGYVPKMLLNFVAGAQPEVMTLDASSAAIFKNNDLLEDLTPFIQRDPEFKLADYYPNVLDIGKKDGEILAIPGDFTPMVMYFNKDLFDKAGVPYPTSNWDFNQFLEIAKELTIPGRQYGFVFPNWMPGWIMWLWNNGGDVLSPDGKHARGFLDSEQNVETVEFLRDLINVHKVAPTLSEAQSLGIDPFANGQAAMCVMGHWAMVDYKHAPKDSQGRPKIDTRRLGVVSLPHNTPKSHTVMYEAGYAIPRGCKHPDLAWKLVKLWSSYRLQSKYNASGIAICARIDVSKERIASDPIEKEFLPIIATARAPWGTRVEGYEAVENNGKLMMDSILKGGVDVRQALRTAAERIDREFAKR